MILLEQINTGDCSYIRRVYQLFYGKSSLNTILTRLSISVCGNEAKETDFQWRDGVCPINDFLTHFPSRKPPRSSILRVEISVGTPEKVADQTGLGHATYCFHTVLSSAALHC